MKATRPRVIIVPTLEEAATIGECLKALAALHDCDVLVIDDSSQDGTADIARSFAGNHQSVLVSVRAGVAARPGLGNALRYAFDLAAELGYRAACVFDSDLQQRPSDARRLLDGVEYGADVAVGSRWMDPNDIGAGVVAGSRWMGIDDVGAEVVARPRWMATDYVDSQATRSSRFASALLRRIFGVPWRDATTDFMAIRLECWTPELSTAVRAGGLFAAFEIRWRIAHSGGIVVEHAAPCRPRAAGRAHGGWKRTGGWALDVLRLAREVLSQTSETAKQSEPFAHQQASRIAPAVSMEATSRFAAAAPSAAATANKAACDNLASDGRRISVGEPDPALDGGAESRGAESATAVPGATPSDNSPGPERVARLIAAGVPLKLHLACGKRFIPGWVHVDVDDWPHVDLVQAVERLPFPDASAAVIYNCHQIAYFDRVTVLDVLAEWRRVLQPGGILRIATADFQAVAAEYALGRTLESFDGLIHGRYPIRASSARRLGLDTAAANSAAGNGRDGLPIPIFYHTTYDFETLRAALERAGFLDVHRYDWRSTEHALVDDYSQAHLPHMDKDNGRLMSLNVETRKPTE